MWITDKFKVVFYNLRSDKRMVRKIVFGMTIVFVLVICFTTVIYSYEKYKDNFNKKHKKDCYYYSEIEEQLIDDGHMSKLFDKSEKIRATYSARSAVTICDIVSRDKKEMLLAGSTRIEVEGKRRSAKYTSAMAVSADAGENIVNDISPIEIAYFQKGMKISPVPGRIDIQGNFPDRQGEIMLDDYILKTFGLELPSETYIGKTISLLYQEGEQFHYLLKNYKVSGVFNSSLLSLRESVWTSDPHLEHIYVNLRKKDRKEFKISNGSTRYYFNDYSEYVANHDNSRDLIHLDLEQVLSGTGEIRITPKGMEYCVLYFLMGNVGKIIFMLGSVICLILIFSIIYLFSFYWYRQKKYRTMLLCIGMQKSDQKWIRVLEIMVFILLAFVLGSYFSAVLLMLLNFVSTTALRFPIRLM